MKWTLPSHDEIEAVFVDCLRENGGRATTQEMYNLIMKKLNLSPEVLELTNTKGEPRFHNSVRQVKDRLKNKRKIENFDRGVYQLP